MENSKLTTSSRTKTRCTVWKKRTLMERYLFLICVVMFIALLITIGIIFHFKHVYKHRSPSVCKSPQCMIEAGRILNHMDATADPCDDFYDYSCGSFLKHHVPGSQFTMIYPTGLPYNSIEKLAKEVLEAPDEKEQPQFIKKVKHQYQNCLNQTGDIADIISKILKVTKLKGWPILDDDDLMDNIETSLAIISIYNGGNPFLMFHFSPNRTEGPLRVSIPGVPFVKHVYTNKTHENYIRRKEKYKKLLEYTLYALSVPPKAIQPVAEEIIEFETNIATIIDDAYDYNETETTLKELSSGCIGVKWIYVIRYIYDYYGYSEDFNEKMLIKIMDKKEYLDDICKLLSKTSHRRIYNYILWNFLSSTLLRTHSYFDTIFNEVSFGVEPFIPPPKWKICVLSVAGLINPGLSYLLIKYIQPEEGINEVQEYASNIRMAMDQTLSEEKWLGAASRDIARKKVKGINVEIGYSKASVDLDLLEKYFAQVNITDDFIETRLLLIEWSTGSSLSKDTLIFSDHVNISLPLSTWSFYGNGIIEIPLGFLLPPYFIRGLPKYINYGSVGVIIAREFSNAFEELDSSSTEGNLERWPEETMEKFKDKKQCYIDQYSKLYSGYSEAREDAELHFKQNLVENSGIIHAFKAYENYVRENGEEPKFSGLDFTDEELFFIKYAQNLCKVEDSRYGEIPDIFYNLPRYRVNGALQNFPRFSETFNCPSDSRMNPKHKCQMFG